MHRIGGFAACSVARGFTEDRFAALSDRDKRDLLKVMARIAEKAYRRGVQQGAEGCGELRGNLHAWRYGRSLDLSPDADTPAMETSIERLATECWDDLRRLGLPIRFSDEEQRARRTERCRVGYTTAQLREATGRCAAVRRARPEAH